MPFVLNPNLSAHRRNGVGGNQGAKIYLMIWKWCCEGARVVHHAGYVHYDIKCDNVLLRHTDFERSDCVCLCDFGECEDLTGGELRARGTECVQSPEVLSIVERNRSEGEKFDRRIRTKPSSASDCWQLSCLLFEVVVGEYLLNDADWGKFWLTLTDESRGEVFGEEGERRLKEGIGEAERETVDFTLKMIRAGLVRNPERRLGAREMAEGVDVLLGRK